MDRVFTQAQKPMAEIQSVAIAIMKTPRPRQRHVGILHKRMDSSDVLILHLAGPNQLDNETPGCAYLWIQPALTDEALAAIAALCRRIKKANPVGVPYGFSPPYGRFDFETGKFLRSASGGGLTCATFVVAVFADAGHSLIEYETWPLTSERVEDQNWQEGIVSYFAGLEGSENALANREVQDMKDEIGKTSRPRPEEVAGAATYDPLPASFQIAEERSKGILRLLGVI